MNAVPGPIYLAWQLDPVFLGGILALGICYGLVVGPLRARLEPGAALPWRQALWFYGGLIIMYLLEGSPLHDLAERYLLSAHMLQHLSLSYLVAPMLLWGAPSWVLKPLLLNRVVAPIARVLTKPLVTFFVFSFFFSAWHLPTIYEAALRNDLLHHAEHLIFLFTSLLLWWPLMSPLEELPRAPYLTQLLYLFTLPIAQIPLFGIMAFSKHVLYPTYAAAPRVLGITPLVDQALGGVLMKVVGLFVFGIPFIVIFFRWYASESSRQQRGSARLRSNSSF